MIRKFLTVALAAFAFGMPSVANAADPEARTNWVQRSLNIAFQAWGYSDALCYDQGYGSMPKVRRAPLPPNAYGWPTAAQANPRTCEITFNSNIYHGRLRRCHWMVHEVGHLYGWNAPEGEGFTWPDGRYDRQHSRSARHVMFPGPARDYWRCRKAVQTGYL